MYMYMSTFLFYIILINYYIGSATGGGDRPQARALVDTAASCRRLV